MGVAGAPEWGRIILPPPHCPVWETQVEGYVARTNYDEYAFVAWKKNSSSYGYSVTAQLYGTWLLRGGSQSGGWVQNRTQVGATGSGTEGAGSPLSEPEGSC